MGAAHMDAYKASTTTEYTRQAYKEYDCACTSDMATLAQCMYVYIRCMTKAMYD